VIFYFNCNIIRKYSMTFLKLYESTVFKLKILKCMKLTIKEFTQL